MNETRFPDAPERIKRLPEDRRGYPVPWFVHWIDGEPDFRVIRPEGIAWADAQALCWICGQRLGRLKCFVIGPMCAVNRISAEPPSHLECAKFAARACPFLVNPRMRRNEKDMPPHRDLAGTMLLRNPGVTLLWATLRYSRVILPDGEWLFNVGKPERVAWYAQGRAASRAECWASMEAGLPALEALADTEDAREALADAWARAVKLLPLGARGEVDG